MVVWFFIGDHQSNYELRGWTGIILMPSSTKIWIVSSGLQVSMMNLTQEEDRRHGKNFEI